MGQDLYLDETINTYCPFCEARHEKKFYITRTSTGLLYYCHRGTCGRHGIVGAEYTDVAGRKRERFKVFKGNLITLPKEIWGEIFSKYDIGYDRCMEQGIKYAQEERRIYFPIYNERGYQIGENLKAVSAETQPKNLILRWSDYPNVHFPLRQEHGDSIVLVEDHISALKIAEVGYSAALMGTHLSTEVVRLFKSMEIKTLKVMLDGDAILPATKIYTDYKGLFDIKIIPLPLTLDPKDLSLLDLRRILL